MQREDFYNNHWLDSLLNHTAERFDSPLQNAAARFDSPLHNAAERLHEFESKFEKNLGYESGSKVCTFEEKKTEVENLTLLSL